MNPFSGLMDGHLFTAEKPVVVLERSTSGLVKAFESKSAAWNYLEAASRGDRLARFARAYELDGNRWERIPAMPTYLQKLEEMRTQAESVSNGLSQVA